MRSLSWFSTDHAARPGRRHAGPMARPRRWGRQPALLLVALGALLTAALTQVAALSNGVVEARRRIGELRQTKAFLEADIGRLEAEWSQASSREAIVPRAERELGLVAAQQPEVVLVVKAAAPAADAVAWRGVREAVGRGGELVAAAAAGERRP